MSKKASRKSFTKGAVKVHKKNVPTRVPMRGGIRL
ncbi:hypothetical protein [Gokushovirinae Fen672_31]|nr:hypothetical protein [Gokushovirinae Fen672_31]AKI26922.1 hypothetical protein [Gokushovirinae Fen672_31]